MIKELFKKKYKHEMEGQKSTESKIDLKKETSSGILNFNGSFKRKEDGVSRQQELQNKLQEEVSDY